MEGDRAPPAGGFGASEGASRPSLEPAEPSSRTGGCVRQVLFLLAGITTLVTVLALGVRRYIHQVKTSEARNELGRIAMLADAAYRRDGKLCPSATDSVPSASLPSMSWESGYQSMRGEWDRDAKRNWGFACLGFGITTAQYYRYSYASTPTDFTARAVGGVPEMGIFEVHGEVRDGKVVFEDIVELR